VDFSPPCCTGVSSIKAFPRHKKKVVAIKPRKWSRHLQRKKATPDPAGKTDRREKLRAVLWGREEGGRPDTGKKKRGVEGSRKKIVYISRT